MHKTRKICSNPLQPHTAMPRPRFLRLMQLPRVAGVTRPNRMVRGAMHTRLETMNRPLQRLVAFHARCATGGIGLALTGGYAPMPEGAADEGGLVPNGAAQLDERRALAQATRLACSL